MKIFAHRGASGYHKDNSEMAILEAFNQKADYVELDIQICGSGELVFNHDLTIKNSNQWIGNLTLSELRQMDSEILDENQVMNLLLNSKLNLNKCGLYLDLKTNYLFEGKFYHKIMEYLEKLVPVYNEKFPNKPLMIASFSHDIIIRIINNFGIDNNIKFGVINYSAPLIDYIKILKNTYGIHFFVLDYRNLNKNLVDSLNKLQIFVILYTINQKEILSEIFQSKFFLKDNFYGIVTNFPDNFI